MTKKRKFRKIIKRTFIALGILLILLVAAVFAIPYFFKDELLALAKDEINKQVNAQVEFEDVELSIFRTFPDLNFSLKGMDVKGVEQFQDVPLAKMKSLDLELDIMSVINGDEIQVNNISLIEPDINVIVLRDGTANYDIAKPSAPDTTQTNTSDESASFQLNLDGYSIVRGNITYDDRQGATYVKLKGLNHSGSGNFTADVFDLTTKTDIESFTAAYDGIAYLNAVKTKADLKFNIDNTNAIYTLKQNKILLNALEINADGTVAMPGSDIKLDLSFDAPSTDFKQFLSMIPSAYSQDFDGVKANGTFSLKGTTKGIYNANSMPAFDIKMSIVNSDFQYPDLPLGINDINTSISIQNPGGKSLDGMVINIPKLHLQLGNNPFDAKLKLLTPISDPDIDTEIKGKIDLAELSKAFPLEGVQSLNGIITSDVKMRTKMSYIDQEAYDKVDMQGALKIEKMNLQNEGQPDVAIHDMQMDFSPQNVKLNNFTADLGKSDVQANGYIDNILAYFTPEKTMTGSLTLRSKKFDANEWMETEPSGSTSTTTDSPPPTEAVEAEVFDRFDFTLDAAFDELLYENYQLKNTIAKGNFTPSKFTLVDFSTKIAKSDIKATGEITNVFNYLYNNEKLYGTLDLSSNLLDVNELMSIMYSETPSTEPPAPSESSATPASTSDASQVALIPAAYDMIIKTKAKQVYFQDLDLKDVDGALIVQNETAKIQNFKSKTLGGAITLNGEYNTQNPQDPTYKFAYDINKFDFQNTFKTLNTFQQINPMGEYLVGNFNSTLEMSGKLDKNMMPDLNTLSAEGFLNTLDAFIKGFKPLQKVGETLKLDYLKNDLDIKNTKNDFTVKDGKVFLKPFDVNFKEIKMNVGGWHGLVSDMKYDVQMTIPREKLGKAGALAGDGLNFLSNEASKFGININNGKMVNVLLEVTGDMKDPKVKIKKISLDGDSVGDMASNAFNDIKDKAVDSIKTVVDDKVNEIKDKAEDKVNEVVDDVKDKVDDKVNEVKDKVEDKVEGVVNDKVDEVKDKVEDKVEDAVGDKVDEVKDKVDGKVKDEIDKWNPFKKNKKDE